MANGNEEEEDKGYTFKGSAGIFVPLLLILGVVVASRGFGSR